MIYISKLCALREPQRCNCKMSSSYLYLNGLRIHYLHWNSGSDGRPVVLLHGLASNARIWELVAPHLATGGMEAIAPDGRGHGLTDKPDSSYDFDTYYQDLSSFINTLELERPLLVGHSWGANLALDYAARIPVGRRAPAGIVLVDGGTIQLDQIPDATWESTRQRLEPPRLAGMPLEELLALLQNVSNDWQPTDAAIQIILANFEISADETISPRLSYAHHMQIVRSLWEFRLNECYERLRCPALLVPARPALPYSEEQGEFLASKERGIQHLTGRFSNIRVRWMQDSTHDIPLQRPAELARLVLDFAG